MNTLSNPVHVVASDERMSRKLFERLRWGDRPVCPHCGSTNSYRLTAKPTSKQPVREGVYKCANCRKQFTVTVGTIFERSHIPLGIWIKAIASLCESVEGITSYALHRLLGITYKSARLIEERIRHAIAQPRLESLLMRQSS
jgi:transposase-like protein